MLNVLKYHNLAVLGCIKLILTLVSLYSIGETSHVLYMYGVIIHNLLHAQLKIIEKIAIINKQKYS